MSPLRPGSPRRRSGWWVSAAWGGHLGARGRLVSSAIHSGEWRNRQTRWLQVPVAARSWGFKSPLAHR